MYYPPAKSTANSPIQNTSWIGASSLPHKKRSISSNSVMAPCSLCLPHDDPTNATNVCFGGKSYMAGYSRRSCGCFIPGRPPSPHYCTRYCNAEESTKSYAIWLWRASSPFIPSTVAWTRQQPNWRVPPATQNTLAAPEHLQPPPAAEKETINSSFSQPQQCTLLSTVKVWWSLTLATN